MSDPSRCLVPPAPRIGQGAIDFKDDHVEVHGGLEGGKPPSGLPRRKSPEIQRPEGSEEGLAPPGKQPTALTPPIPVSPVFARSRSNSSPQGYVRPSVPRAAFSHSASEGRVTIRRPLARPSQNPRGSALFPSRARRPAASPFSFSPNHRQYARASNQVTRTAGWLGEPFQSPAVLQPVRAVRHEGGELPDRHRVPRHIEGRQDHFVPGTLVFIAFRIVLRAPHPERAGGDRDETQERIARQEPAVRAILSPFHRSWFSRPTRQRRGPHHPGPPLPPHTHPAGRGGRLRGLLKAPLLPAGGSAAGRRGVGMMRACQRRRTLPSPRQLHGTLALWACPPLDSPARRVQSFRDQRVQSPEENGSTTTRKPMSPKRRSGSNLPRNAQRANQGPLKHEPPRTTRRTCDEASRFSRPSVLT